MTAAATSRLHAGKPDYAILVTATALVVVGLIFVYSASFSIALASYRNVDYFIVRQGVSAVIGFAAMIMLMRFDYRRLRVLSPALMLLSVLGLLAVLFIGGSNYGARRWITISALPPIQPSEFAKLAMVIYIAAWLSARGRDVRSFFLGVVPFVFLVGVVAALVFMEPDAGTAFIIVITTATLFFIAGASITHIATMMAIGSVTGSLLVLAHTYRADRIFAFASAEKDPTGVGYQVIQLLIALGSGGVQGLGLGVSRQKFFYIPGAHTDGIFAIIGEETGLIGCMLVLGLFAYFAYRGFRVVLNARDDFGAYLATGIVAWIGFQTLINIGGITRSIPLTGIPLPLVSYGGSSLIAVMAGIGVLLSVSRYGRDQTYVERPPARRMRPRHQVRSPATVAAPSPATTTRIRPVSP